MTYEFGPRDLEEPMVERSYDAPEEALATAFETWLERCAAMPKREIGGAVSDERYELAVELLDGTEVTPATATTLVLSHREAIAADPAVGADVGLFLSAAYDRADEPCAFYDVESPVGLKRLGYRLRPGRTLVIDAPVAGTMAVESEGLVVNRSAVDGYFGYAECGAFVNLGSCSTFGTGASAVAVDLGTVGGHTDGEGDGRGGGMAGGGPAVSLARTDGRIAVDPDAVDDVPGLRAFLDRLEAGLSGDHEDVRAFLSDLDPTPRAAIERELREILVDDGKGAEESTAGE